MQKVAIISYFHYEASLCLAKAISEQGLQVDCFVVIDMHHDTGHIPGLDYHLAPKRPGLVKLTPDNAPEIYEYTKGLAVNFYLFRIVSYSRKLMLLNRIVFKNVLKRIRNSQYDAINIVGQWPWVEIIHNELKDQNLTHTFHEIGNHFNGELSTPLIQAVIKDKSKVIVPSLSTLQRFRTIDSDNQCYSKCIPFGCFETLLLYRKTSSLEFTFNNDYPTFLYFGYIKPYKGLDLLAEACRKLNEGKVCYNLIIAGGGDDPNLSFFKSLNNCVLLNRFMNDDEMAYLNEISDVVLLPYKTASQSGIVPTSFMFGNPIIATNVGALGEVIKHDVNGILVEPDNPISFAKAINTLANDRSLLKKLKEGVAYFGHDDEYDWRNIAKATIDVLYR